MKKNSDSSSEQYRPFWKGDMWAETSGMHWKYCVHNGEDIAGKEEDPFGELFHHTYTSELWLSEKI